VFTGIVEEVGRVVEINPLGGGLQFRVSAERVLEGCLLGDSIAIEGACQTVTELGEGAFGFQSIATTLERTTFGEFEVGRPVNLERALALGQRLGGHMVQGHVDGVGEVLSIDVRGEHVLIDFSVPPPVEEVTILRGSITINGVSLTVNDVPAAGVVQVSIIPHTWEVTTISSLVPGARVNVEGDMIGKYVRHLLGRPGEGSGATEHLLRAWGY
jgi:riboflavin synthase